MTPAEIEEEFEALFEDIGTPETLAPITKAEIEALEGRVPAALIWVLEKYGRASLYGGRAQQVHPDDLAPVMKAIFGKDPQLAGAEGYVLTAFGEIEFWTNDFGGGSVDLLTGYVTCNGVSMPPETDRTYYPNHVFLPYSYDAEDIDFEDLDDKALFGRLKRKFGAPGLMEVYGFVPAIQLGGAPSLETAKIQPAREHLAFLASASEFTLLSSPQLGEVKELRSVP